MTVQCLDRIEWKCEKDNKCIPIAWKCDKEVDCPDSSDEKNCGMYDKKQQVTRFLSCDLYLFICYIVACKF